MRSLHNPSDARKARILQIVPFSEKNAQGFWNFSLRFYGHYERLLTLRVMYTFTSYHVFPLLDNIFTEVCSGVKNGGVTGRVLRGKSAGRCCTK